MGHYFVYADSTQVMGVNNGGEIIVVRRDQVDGILDAIRNDVWSESSKKDALGALTTRMFYPSAYISEMDARIKYAEAYQAEKRVYEIFRPKFYASYANFMTSDLGIRMDGSLLDSILKIFFMNSGSLRHELQASGSTLIITKKPSAITRLFSNARSGEIVGSCLVKDIKNVQVSENEIRFYKGREVNFMTLTRDRCYT